MIWVLIILAVSFIATVFLLFWPKNKKKTNQRIKSYNLKEMFISDPDLIRVFYAIVCEVANKEQSSDELRVFSDSAESFNFGNFILRGYKNGYQEFEAPFINRAVNGKITWVANDNVWAVDCCPEDFYNAGYKLFKDSGILENNKEKSRREMKPSLRYDVMRRDNFTCQICGRNHKEDGIKLHIDHICPVSKGGKSEIANLQALCEECNLGKSAKY